MSKKPVIGIISAGNRYNYGDVLHDVVMKEYIKISNRKFSESMILNITE